MLSVQNYKDYRKYLEDVFLSEKTSSKLFISKKIFSKKIGLSDSNFRMILSGQRNLTLDKAVIIAKALKLSQYDSDYFLNLVYKNSLKNNESKKIIENKLYQIELESKSNLNTVNYKEFILDSKLQVLLLFIKDNNFSLKNENEIIIAAFKKLKLNPPETRVLLRKINDLEILKVEKNNIHIIYSKLFNNFSRDEFFKNEFIEASKHTNKPNCLFSTKTFSIPKSQIDSFAQEYKKLTEKYMIYDSNKNEDLEIIRVLFHLRSLTY